jgi:16S rRNA processing protein RimM
MFFENDELTEVALIVRTYSLTGQLSFKMHPDFSNNIIKNNMPVFLLTQGIPVPFFTESVKDSGGNRIVKLKHVDDEENAKKYIGCKVYIIYVQNDEIELEEDSEYKDYSVFDKKFGFIGKFERFNMIPGNTVFETSYKGKTIIFPFADNFIHKIDDVKKEIHIESPEGLIELYLE